jgi:hypothetical protein
MKPLRALFVLLLVACIVCTGWLMAQKNLEHRLRSKAAEAETDIRLIAARGGDPTPILAIMQQVKPALDAGHPHQAEALLDRAHSLASETLQKLQPGNSSPLPVDEAPEKQSNLYIDPQPVAIEGYQGNAMEPFISPDGQYLFFNNENDPRTDTNLYWARRTGTRSFRSLGELPGANSPSLDAVASLDAAGHFYFTTLRTYDRTMNSIYTGDFNQDGLSNVRPVPGDISPKIPGTVNMDVSISPDGQTLYISRAVIVPGASAPKKSELMVAVQRQGAFHLDPNSTQIMHNINTGALQYAPCISADGLELYFTRASQRPSGPSVRIMVATRSSASQPFGEPEVLQSLSGFVEAPSISADSKEMFFHKKVGDRYTIYRAERKRNMKSDARVNPGHPSAE